MQVCAGVYNAMIPSRTLGLFRYFILIGHGLLLTLQTNRSTVKRWKWRRSQELYHQHDFYRWWCASTLTSLHHKIQLRICFCCGTSSCIVGHSRLYTKSDVLTGKNNPRGLYKTLTWANTLMKRREWPMFSILSYRDGRQMYILKSIWVAQWTISL